MVEIAPFRLNLLRAGYLLLIIGLGLTLWPSILDPTTRWESSRGVVVMMLAGMSLLALIGLRHPLRMLPLLFWDLAWKAVWLLRVALPAWADDRLDAAMIGIMTDCLVAIVLIAVIPWDYVFQVYLKGPGDGWRRRPLPGVATELTTYHNVPEMGAEQSN